MPSLSDILGEQNRDNNPPARIKIFAPNGATLTFVGWLGVKEAPGISPPIQVFYREDVPNVKDKPLNRKVVVQNLETGEVIYDPRQPYTRRMMTKGDLKWLERNPHWPAILELYDMPVEDDAEGIE